MATTRRRGFAFAALAVGFSIALAGCTAAETPTVDPTGEADVLGTPNPATGEPVVFGVLNLETGPVAFPEARESLEAAVAYVNEYLGGLGGRPIEIVSCATDGQPATSARCANQILDSNPVAILGAADTGAPGAVEVWARAGIPYIGGVPFTPVESNYENAVIFSSASVGDPAGAAAWGAQNLDVKKAAVIFASDTQGTASAQGIIIPTLKNAGVEEVVEVTLPPGVADVSAAVATTVAAAPDLVFIVSPPNCPNIMSSLLQLGNTAAVFGIDPCTSPAAIEGANGGAEGLYFASPTLSPFADTEEGAVFRAVVEKYAPELEVSSLAIVTFQGVINTWAALQDFEDADFTTESILAAFRTESGVGNFLGHPYTCDGKQFPGRSAICTKEVRMNQIKDGVPAQIEDDWIDATEFYVPAGPPQ